MIHDAKVEVTCDKCGTSWEIQPEYKYRDYSGRSGFYDTSDSAIAEKLEEADWIVRDDKQFCSEECAND